MITCLLKNVYILYRHIQYTLRHGCFAPGSANHHSIACTARPVGLLLTQISLSLYVCPSPCMLDSNVTRTTLRFSRWLTACIAAERRYLIASRLLLLLPSTLSLPVVPFTFALPWSWNGVQRNWHRQAVTEKLATGTKLSLYTLYTKMSDVKLLSLTTLSNNQYVMKHNYNIIQWCKYNDILEQQLKTKQCTYANRLDVVPSCRLSCPQLGTPLRL